MSMDYVQTIMYTELQCHILSILYLYSVLWYIYIESALSLTYVHDIVIIIIQMITRHCNEVCTAYYTIYHVHVHVHCSFAKGAALT